MQSPGEVWVAMANVKNMNGTFLLTMPATVSGGNGSDALAVREPLLALSLLGMCLATVAILMLSAKVGFWLGKYQSQRLEVTRKAPMAEIVGAMLGLLAFMLGFTFSLAFSRFDARRALVVDEANAIGTTYLRAGLLTEPFRTKIHKLLCEYVKARLTTVQSGDVAKGIAHAEELHGRLWVQAEAAGREDPGSIVVGLFISSLNEVIDMHAKRLEFGLRNHIPTTIWAGLYFLAICTMATMGYHTGLAGARRFVAIIPLVFTFSAVFSLIADLDRPQAGLLKVSQKALVELLDKFNAEDLGLKLSPVPSVQLWNKEPGMSGSNNHHQFAGNPHVRTQNF